ncbi:uncharacterized protein LOC133377049 [Rhineura floridana]|uniref:uncharacterized protein LOC133377049 n=1 Tax=Rhineura floridana TaxID=261503 RepID=UPI002AC86392|nr:uncharacterized protein LOC133377049 [Rhineura floridana]
MNVPYVGALTPALAAPGAAPSGVETGIRLAQGGQGLQAQLRERGPSPIKIAELRHLLHLYPLVLDAQFLLEGFTVGFRIPYLGPRRPFMSCNLKSVEGMESVLREKIRKEVVAGRVLGPFAAPPIPSLRVSPLGLVPKRAPGEFRLIHHLSFPQGESVNDFIPAELCSVRYTSFDCAVRMVRDCGVGALMGKCDIKSAFRLLPVHPQDFELLGLAFDGEYYVDRALPMGCSISCSVFERFSSFLEWAVKRRAGLQSVVHYLDDYLFAGPADSGTCRAFMAHFAGLAGELGVPLAAEKTEGPSTAITFLGIEIDTVAQCCRLPQDKLGALREKISEVVSSNKVTLATLQRLAGQLNFACGVVAPGRAFLRRVYDAMAGLSRSYHRTRVTAALRADLTVWSTFLRDFNGVSLWRRDRLLEAELQVHSDASGAFGFGVILHDSWCHGSWPQGWTLAGLTRDLTFLEFFPIVVAVHLWPDKLCNSSVHFWCDNLPTVHVINTLSSRNPNVMLLVRAFVLQCLRYNIQFLARHVPGIDNSIADALSRNQMEKFRQLAPWARALPEAFPPALWEIGGLNQKGP